VRVLWIIGLFLLIEACNSADQKNEKVLALPFSSEKWQTRNEENYPYRAQMYREVLYSDSIRSLKRADVISMLGNPDREENNHHYYVIEKKALGTWTISQKAMVIKYHQNDAVDWIKMYE